MATNTALATLRMSPEIDVADSFQSPTDVSGTISESGSDDGSHHLAIIMHGQLKYHYD